jgi:oligopeptide transport system substrate-binding protein
MAPHNQMAESIKTTDNKTFDVTIKKGWKFHDGTEVKAKNYVDAWNYAVSNGLGASSFMEPIQGYDQAVPPEDNPKPTGKTMSGLKVKNDYEFTITLNKPFTIFPTILGYDAFSPMPDSFFKNPAAWDKHPIGNGPLKFVEYRPNAYIKLQRFDGYQGEDKVHFKNLEYKIYPGGREPAYQDLLSGQLDFMEDMPPSALAGKKYESDLGDRVVTNHLLTDDMLAFPLYDKTMANSDLHKAISMAINRKQITDQVFEGTRKPMTGWVPASMPGAKAGACGEFCEYNPQKAKEYLKKSGFKGTINLSSNSDGGHKEWIEAVCGNIENTLPIKCNFTPATSFGAFREQIEAHTMKGPFRTGWVADYPAIENFLAPLYSTNGSSNDNGFTNKAFDAKVLQANSAPTKAEADTLYQQAEQMLSQDMATLPLWTQEGVAGHSENVSNVKLTPKRWLDMSSITVTG